MKVFSCSERRPAHGAWRGRGEPKSKLRWIKPAPHFNHQPPLASGHVSFNDAPQPIIFSDTKRSFVRSCTITTLFLLHPSPARLSPAPQWVCRFRVDHLQIHPETCCVSWRLGTLAAAIWWHLHHERFFSRNLLISKCFTSFQQRDQTWMVVYCTKKHTISL